MVLMIGLIQKKKIGLTLVKQVQNFVRGCIQRVANFKVHNNK